MYWEYQTFQLKLLLSLNQGASLDENLRAIIGPTLWMVRNYCKAGLAVHVFVNPEISELHALAVGHSPNTRESLLKECERRHNPEAKSSPGLPLPAYKSIELPSVDEGRIIADIFSPLKEIRTEFASSTMVWMFGEIKKCFPDEFEEHALNEGDTLLLIPLGTSEYPRLGCILVWESLENLKKFIDNTRKNAPIITFRKGMEQFIVRLFRNFYHIEPHTYLPSYYQVGIKPVALLCAEISEFDRVSEILRKSHHLGDEAARECLRKLVNSFAEKVAEIVEQKCYRGRIDQIAGNRLLVVFGEYLDTPDPSPKAVCTRAVLAAASLANKLRELIKSWLKDDFDFEQFCKDNNEQIILGPAIAVDYGKVVFDYIGSPQKRMYMAIGDHVNFVKHMASLVGRVGRDGLTVECIMRPSSTTMKTTPFGFHQINQAAPILLSQSAYTSSMHILKDKPGDVRDSVHQAQTIRLPGRPTPYSAFEIWPENVDDKVS